MTQRKDTLAASASQVPCVSGQQRSNKRKRGMATRNGWHYPRAGEQAMLVQGKVVVRTGRRAATATGKAEHLTNHAKRQRETDDIVRLLTTSVSTAAAVNTVCDAAGSLHPARNSPDAVHAPGSGFAARVGSSASGSRGAGDGGHSFVFERLKALRRVTGFPNVKGLLELAPPYSTTKLPAAVPLPATKLAPAGSKARSGLDRASRSGINSSRHSVQHIVHGVQHALPPRCGPPGNADQSLHSAGLSRVPGPAPAVLAGGARQPIGSKRHSLQHCGPRTFLHEPLPTSLCRPPQAGACSSAHVKAPTSLPSPLTDRLCRPSPTEACRSASRRPGTPPDGLPESLQSLLSQRLSLNPLQRHSPGSNKADQQQCPGRRPPVILPDNSKRISPSPICSALPGTLGGSGSRHDAGKQSPAALPDSSGCSDVTAWGCGGDASDSCAAGGGADSLLQPHGSAQQLQYKARQPKGLETVGREEPLQDAIGRLPDGPGWRQDNAVQLQGSTVQLQSGVGQMLDISRELQGSVHPSQGSMEVQGRLHSSLHDALAAQHVDQGCNACHLGEAPSLLLLAPQDLERASTAAGCNSTCQPGLSNGLLSLPLSTLLDALPMGQAWQLPLMAQLCICDNAVLQGEQRVEFVQASTRAECQVQLCEQQALVYSTLGHKGKVEHCWSYLGRTEDDGLPILELNIVLISALKGCPSAAAAEKKSAAAGASAVAGIAAAEAKSCTAADLGIVPAAGATAATVKATEGGPVAIDIVDATAATVPAAAIAAAAAAAAAAVLGPEKPAAFAGATVCKPQRTSTHSPGVHQHKPQHKCARGHGHAAAGPSLQAVSLLNDGLMPGTSGQLAGPARPPTSSLGVERSEKPRLPAGGHRGKPAAEARPRPAPGMRQEKPFAGPGAEGQVPAAAASRPRPPTSRPPHTSAMQPHPSGLVLTHKVTPAAAASAQLAKQAVPAAAIAKSVTVGACSPAAEASAKVAKPAIPSPAAAAVAEPALLGASLPAAAASAKVAAVGPSPVGTTSYNCPQHDDGCASARPSNEGARDGSHCCQSHHPDTSNHYNRAPCAAEPPPLCSADQRPVAVSSLLADSSSQPTAKPARPIPCPSTQLSGLTTMCPLSLRCGAPCHPGGGNMLQPRLRCLFELMTGKAKGSMTAAAGRKRRAKARGGGSSGRPSAAPLNSSGRSDDTTICAKESNIAPQMLSSQQAKGCITDPAPTSTPTLTPKPTPCTSIIACEGVSTCHPQEGKGDAAVGADACQGVLSLPMASLLDTLPLTRQWELPMAAQLCVYDDAVLQGEQRVEFVQSNSLVECLVQPWVQRLLSCTSHKHKVHHCWAYLGRTEDDGAPILELNLVPDMAVAGVMR